MWIEGDLMLISRTISLVIRQEIIQINKHSSQSKPGHVEDLLMLSLLWEMTLCASILLIIITVYYYFSTEKEESDVDFIARLDQKR